MRDNQGRQICHDREKDIPAFLADAERWVEQGACHGQTSPDAAIISQLMK